MTKKGTELIPREQKEVLRMYVHRFTRTHVPLWAKEPRPNGAPYMPQFEDDQDWLANTHFVVKNDGTLDRRNKGCYSVPTWPLGKG